MKNPIFAVCLTVALALGCWSLKRALDRPASNPSSPLVTGGGIKATHVGKSANNNEGVNAQTGASAMPGQKASDPVLAQPINSQAPAASPPSTVLTTATKNAQVPSKASPVSSGPTSNSAISRFPEYPITGSVSGTASTGLHSTGGAVPSSTVNYATQSPASPSVAGAENSMLEVDTGVPLPAALLPADEEIQSPIVQATQEQLANTFLEEVDAALSLPETANTDASVNETYYNALETADELYRALYGETAYNQKTMQATLDAQSGE